MKDLYVYRAQPLRAVDGDTLDVLLDCGFKTYRTERLRLLGVNTPELHSKVTAERKAAEQAKTWLQETLDPESDLAENTAGFDSSHFTLVVQTKEQDAFGRWLSTVWLDDLCINDEILKLGLGGVYKRKKTTKK